MRGRTQSDRLCIMLIFSCEIQEYMLWIVGVCVYTDLNIPVFLYVFGI
jgi:hypothetical protein